jgi:glycosyltransferase involved in cell wall biosynthesis
MTTKISICIPAYRQADKLHKLLKSIEIQTVKPFEIIVSDDSDDEAVEQLCKQSDLPLRYFRHTPALGSPENWNFAIQQASGDWIKLMHHDDYFSHEKALENFLSAINMQKEKDYFFCGTRIEQGSNGSSHIYEVDKKLIDRLNKYPAYLLHKNLIGAPSTGFFRNTIQIHYDKSLIWLVDVEYYIRLMENYRLGYLIDPAITTVMFEGQLTTRLKDNRQVELSEFIYCYLKHINKFDRLNRKIMRFRMIDLFRIFEVRNLGDLVFPINNNKIPLYSKVFLFCCRINRRLAFSVFYRLNNFDLNK